MPKYISYKVAINKTNIAIGKNYNPKLTLKEGYNLDKDTSLKVELGIDPSSDYYIFNTEATHTRCLLTALLSSLIILISLFWVLRIRAKTKSYIANLESELSGKELMIQALNQNRQMDQALKLLFIKKATEMYIRKEVALNSFDKVILDSIEPNYFLFPLRLTDSTPSKVEVDKLERDIKEYFGYKLLNSQITFYHEVDSIRVPCSKEVFYQLIFSLLYNLLTGTVN
ncbi:MAG: hypothetical protein K0Q51_1426 [Rickettsiaceae bacterium]|nr:hypothetical protein [Rickettsiaceae bacterium]